MSTSKIKVIFFDLFFTLITPKYNYIRNEYDVLGLTREQWESYAEDSNIYRKRALVLVKEPMQIIEDIISLMNIVVDENAKREILYLREERMKQALLQVDESILDVLTVLKKNGIKLCLISNLDVIDSMHWKESPLSPLFEEVIFSHVVGLLKPEPEIYKLALDRMNAKPEECVFIGDGGSNELKGAKEQGIHTTFSEYLLKRNNENEIENIKKYAEFTISDFSELINLVKEI
jgi:putative hydrolase of the HAD superfamily